MNLETIRHSLSHVLAAAVLEVKPDTNLGIGPAISTGFYYDFKFSGDFSETEFKDIEKRMRKIIQKKLPFEHYELPVDEAIEYYKKLGNEFKVELINDLKNDGITKVGFYKLGEFVDLCKGPHVNNTSEIPTDIFKIDKTAGAYWRGDEKNQMLTRIYALAFESKEELDKYILRREEALKRDHRKLGAELDLFSTSDEVGPGLVSWHPKGARIRYLIENFWKKEHYKNGYELVNTPHIGRSLLWETSGHLGFYADNMYSPMEIDENNYYVKPMNCPFHVMIYKTSKRSYRNLPLRWAELGTVYRYEKSGVLHGLMRVRGFTQDDAHVICAQEQIDDEIAEVLRFSLKMWKDFGFKEIKAYVATRPENSPGDDAKWNTAIEALKKAVTKEGIAWEMDEGGGAFYGPKIDLKVKDALDREWQMTTIQFDFNLPERFDMTYTDNEGKEKRPFMVHRALLGSLERFFGVLIEHYAGAFPVWLAPVQLRLLSVTDRCNEFITNLESKLKENDIRFESDIRNESVGKKIREGRLQRIPYLVVIGDAEVQNNTLMVRNRDTQEQKPISIDDFINIVKKEEETRSLTLSV
ncbi:MAG: threonine--tRNA ligase [bacterium]